MRQFAVIGTGSVMVFSHQVLLIKQSRKKLQWCKRSGWIDRFFSLVNWKVTANQEQYVYFDGTKGDLQSILVNVGDQVTAGQPIVQYSSTEAQTAYDAAVRAVNKADRQLMIC